MFTYSEEYMYKSSKDDVTQLDQKKTVCLKHLVTLRICFQLVL